VNQDIERHLESLEKKVQLNLKNRRKHLLSLIEEAERKLRQFPKTFPWEIVMLNQIRRYVQKNAFMPQSYRRMLRMFNTMYETHMKKVMQELKLLEKKREEIKKKAMN